jgi:Transposase family tnp2
MWDIKDGTRVKELSPPNRATFWDGLKQSELQLLWSLSINWFNPQGNKAAGKSTFTGSISMACLNLPPSLCYKSENLFLAGIIPGPKEPSVEVGHFIEPIVDMLDRSWRDSTKFDCTKSSDCGRTQCSMLVVIVMDLIAS